MPLSEDSFRFAALLLVEVKVADQGTVFALPVTTLGMNDALALQVQVKYKCSAMSVVAEY